MSKQEVHANPMSDKKLAQRFQWWWRDPVKALRTTLPNESDEDTWRFLQRASKNYELSSRRYKRMDGQVKYLLGKPFNQLSREQICEVAGLWSSRDLPIRFVPHAEISDVTAMLHQLAKKHDVSLSMVKRIYAQETGRIVLHPLEINAQRSPAAIKKAIAEYVDAEYERLGISAPPRNEGSANRCEGEDGRSFHDIEALDVCDTHSRKEAKAMGYNDGLARRARRKAGELLSEWDKSTERKISRMGRGY